MRKNREKKQKNKHLLALTFLFSFIVFCILFITLLFASVTICVLVRVGTLSILKHTYYVNYVVIFMVVISLGIGLIISLIIGRIPLKSFNRLIEQMNQLASGNFDVKFYFWRPISNIPVLKEMQDSFNKMAEDLRNTEMLRQDFINNFSHEFKTPIVSIAGFAKLLKRGNLTEEQKAEYLDIIEEESMRLASMATNVLNLTKIENQTILTDCSNYNLSEQIRFCFLLLENKWEKKKIDFSLEFDEYMIHANEELLKQVWINLMDNAIKFSPVYGVIVVSIEEQEDTILVSISNTGEEIAEEKQKKIFNKFYQGEESHTTEGNGVGLAVVKRIVELHNGTILVHSKNGMNLFGIQLPKQQGKI